MSRHNFGEHSHGMTRNSSPLLHLVIVQLAYFQTGKGHWQKKLMIKPVMFPHTVPEYLVDEGWISHLGRRNGTLLVFLRPLAASIAGGAGARPYNPISGLRIACNGCALSRA